MAEDKAALDMMVVASNEINNLDFIFKPFKLKWSEPFGLRVYFYNSETIWWQFYHID